VRGLRFLFANPRLLKYAALPTLINVVLVCLLFYLGVRFSHELVSRLMPAHAQWYWEVLTYSIEIVVIIMLIFFLAVVFYILAGIICVPFNDVLSRKTEEILAGKKDEEPFSMRIFAKDIVFSLKNEIKRTFILLILLLFLLIMYVIPIVGKPAYLVVGNIMTMLFLAYDNLDYALARRRLSFGRKWKFILGNLSSTLGFGAGALFSVFVPFFNFIIIPLTVVGATLLFVEIERWNGRDADMRPSLQKGTAK
jgi:uncharacterized protein involved in cysteine biosynthesis